MEYLIRDRLSWMRFLGFDLGAPTPDAKARMGANGKPQIDIAIPSFGYKSHIGIDRR